MGIEDRRRKMMANQTTWGAPPPSSPSQRSSTTSPAPAARANPGPSSSSSLLSNYDKRASHLSTLAYSRMGPTPPHQDRYSRVHISTRDWSLEDLLSKSSNFYPVDRILQYSHKLAVAIKEYEDAGKPLIIEKWEKHKNWDKASFTVEHFVNSIDQDTISVRNVHDWTDKSMLLTEFINRSRDTSQFASHTESERLYGKDAPCPSLWSKWLQKNKTLPESLLPEGPGDLLRFRPKDEHVETLMCYVGIGDTFTPCHKDLCASSGHNLMVYTEDDGSSFWFMTDSASAPEAEKYFNSLQEVLDHETHVITVEQLAKAPFNIYIAEQKLGDLVLVPPRSCHQVVNYGGITIKASWSRMTLRGLETALYHELPLYRRVCRVETYRVKDTTYHALIRLTDELEKALENRRLLDRESSTSTLVDTPTVSKPILDASGFRKLLENVRFLIDLYRSILMEDFPDSLESSPNESDDDSQRCDFCGADIFQTYFTCQENCKSQDGNCVICSGCYIEGRTCECENMKPVQCRPFSELLSVHDNSVKVFNSAIHGGVCADGMKAITRGLPPGKNPRIFQAALALYRTRKETQRKPAAIRVCSVPKDGLKHKVPSTWGLWCASCHASKCYSHILADHRIHAVRALLSSNESGGYHEAHRKSKERFDETALEIVKSQKKGTKPSDGHMLLVHNALTFGTCKPINSGCTKPGWYDETVQIINSPPSTIVVSEASLSVRDVSAQPAQSSFGKRSRISVPYILVPDAPYLRSRKGNCQENQSIIVKDPRGKVASAASPVLPRTKRRKSTSDGQPSSTNEITVARSRGALITSPQVFPSEPLPSVAPPSPLSRKRKRQETMQPKLATAVTLQYRHKSLEEALNGAGSINGRLPTESEEESIAKLNRRTLKPKAQSGSRLVPKTRRTTTTQPRKSKALQLGTSSRSNNDMEQEDEIEVHPIGSTSNVTRSPTLRTSAAKRKSVSLKRNPTASSQANVESSHTTGQNASGQGAINAQDRMEDTAQINIGPIYNFEEADGEVGPTMDVIPAGDSSPSGPSRHAPDEGIDPPATFNPNLEHVPSRLRKRPRFEISEESYVYDAHNIINNSFGEDSLQDPSRQQLEGQSATQRNTSTDFPDGSPGFSHLITVDFDHLVRLTEEIARRATEDAMNSFLRRLEGFNVTNEQSPRETSTQIASRQRHEAQSGSMPALQGGDSDTVDLKKTLKDLMIEIISSDKSILGQAMSLAPPANTRTEIPHPSTSPTNGHYPHMHYPQTTHVYGYGDGPVYQQSELPGPSAPLRPDDKGDSSRYRQNDMFSQRPSGPSRRSYQSSRQQFTPRNYSRPRNLHYNNNSNTMQNGIKYQRQQWDRPGYDPRPASTSKVPPARYRPFDNNRRVTRSATRRQDDRSDHSLDSPREPRRDREFARSPSPLTDEGVRENYAPAAEGRITRSSAANRGAAVTTGEHPPRDRARTPGTESPARRHTNEGRAPSSRTNTIEERAPPSRRNTIEERDNETHGERVDERATERTNERANERSKERSIHRKTPMEAHRDPQDWEEEYAQDDHPYEQSRAEKPSSLNSEKNRDKRALDDLQSNPWKS